MPDDLRDAHAVLIGVGEYDSGSELPRIPGVQHALIALHEALVQRCGLDRTAVRMILNPYTQDNLADEIAAALATASGHPVIFYYIGHGMIDIRSELYLATRATKGGAGFGQPAALSYDRVRSILRDVQATAIVMILDCCFSATAIETFAKIAKIEGGYVLTSASRNKTAKVAGDDGPAFTAALLKLLETGEPGGPPYLDLDTVYRHLKRALSSLQVPYSLDMNETGTRILADNPAYAAPAIPPKITPSVTGNGRRRRWIAGAVAAVVLAAGAVAGALALQSDDKPPASQRTTGPLGPAPTSSPASAVVVPPTPTGSTPVVLTAAPDGSRTVTVSTTINRQARAGYQYWLVLQVRYDSSSEFYPRQNLAQAPPSFRIEIPKDADLNWKRAGLILEVPDDMSRRFETGFPDPANPSHDYLLKLPCTCVVSNEVDLPFRD
ncbi:caspase domain-containing protein [Dactylosporangium sp. NPDC000521]|uniref:caspase family protein n=1 Tax=Dactylosporangium sp. NPDC000521 TaxID=3363975 RepID=UPI0036B1AE14